MNVLKTINGDDRKELWKWVAGITSGVIVTGTLIFFTFLANQVAVANKRLDDLAKSVVEIEKNIGAMGQDINYIKSGMEERMRLIRENQERIRQNELELRRRP